jgi:uncharacterized protein YndB with AHSA1/START domain
MEQKRNQMDIKPFIISRDFNAPRSMVWKAFSDPDRMKQWWGPKGFTVQISKMDFRAGGIFHYCLSAADGIKIWGKFIYKEIVPEEKIVCIDCFSDEKGGLGRHPMSPDWPQQMITTFRFTEQNEKTTFAIEWMPYESTDKEIKTFDEGRDSMKGGWTGTLDQLTEYIDSQPFVIERTFKASIEKVWAALTDKIEMKKWYFDVPAFKPEVGCDFEFTAGDSTKQYRHLCKVTEVLVGKKITYSWRYDGFTGNSFVTFDLFAEGQSTRLKLTHKGLNTFPKDNPDLAKDRFAAGWTAIVGKSLKIYLEGAKI